MKKSLLMVILIALLLSTGCSKNGGQINIMDLEREIVPMNWIPGPVSGLQKVALNNPYGFVIKVLVTENFENILHYADWLHQGICIDTGLDLGYDRNVHPLDSHILTEVVILEIYRIGDNISFEIGDTISLVEDAFITTTLNEDGSEHIRLNLLEWTIKMEPGNEYLVIGSLERHESFNHTARYGQLIARTVSPINSELIENIRPSIRVQRSISETRGDYWCSSNAEQVIWDFIEDYRTHLRDAGWDESMWGYEFNPPRVTE